VNLKVNMLIVETADPPGLLLDIIKMVTKISILEDSAEVDIEGLVARDYFCVFSGGQALRYFMIKSFQDCQHKHPF
jgi:hypothetical protein